MLKLDIPANATTETPWWLTRVSRHRYYLLIPTREGSLSGPGIIDYEQSRDLDQMEPNSDIYAFAKDQVVSVSRSAWT